MYEKWKLRVGPGNLTELLSRQSPSLDSSNMNTSTPHDFHPYFPVSSKCFNWLMKNICAAIIQERPEISLKNRRKAGRPLGSRKKKALARRHSLAGAFSYL